MRDAAAQFMEDMFNQREPYCLTFLGPPGTGKSFLAYLVDEFFQTFLWGKKDIADSAPGEDWKMTGGFEKWNAALRLMLDLQDWGNMGGYRGNFFMVFDDIMPEGGKLGPISANKLFEIIEARHRKRWTIITANGDIPAIETQLDPRIGSRIMRNENVYITLPESTPDYATLKK